MMRLIYGNQQQFRFRHGDINLLGKTDAALPVRRSVYQLNGGSPIHFYVEPEPKPNGRTYPWGTKTPSVLRLRDHPGHFNVEIPISHPDLQTGWNQITLQIEDATGTLATLEANFHWNPSPVSLPLDLTDLSDYQSIQDIAQVVNGTFDLDPEKSVIRSREPVGADILLLLGSPHRSQEATYTVKFAHPRGWCFLGLSDFFAGHLEQAPELGIKPGYCTAGLATLDHAGLPQIWMAWGDCLYNKPDTWVIKTKKPMKLPIQAGVTYRIRHQVVISEGSNFGRFRIWKQGNSEPDVWAAQADNRHLDPAQPRITQASFGLFQYWGLPTEWSNIQVRSLDIEA